MTGQEETEEKHLTKRKKKGAPIANFSFRDLDLKLWSSVLIYEWGTLTVKVDYT